MTSRIGSFLQESVADGLETQFRGAFKEQVAGTERLARGVGAIAGDLIGKGADRLGHADLKEKTAHWLKENERRKNEASYHESCGTMDRISGKWQAKVAGGAELGRQALEQGSRIAQAASDFTDTVHGGGSSSKKVKENKAEGKGPKSLLAHLESGQVDIQDSSESDGEEPSPPRLANRPNRQNRPNLSNPLSVKKEGGPRSLLAGIENEESDVEDLSSESDEEELSPPRLANRPNRPNLSNPLSVKNEGGPRSLLASGIENESDEDLSAESESDVEEKEGYDSDSGAEAISQNDEKGFLGKLTDVASSCLEFAGTHYANVPTSKSKNDAVAYAGATYGWLMWNLGQR